MGKALYRKYRSKALSEIVGQEHITTTLENALQKGALSHAYLFTGPRGTGKTSIARILAHQINNIPYQDDATHLDIIEIDAASNRRIEDARELRERIHAAPASAKYKVYIIDEVHMLTKEAFNALLKTLEEPPEHAIFILATTEAHKLPETIISRTQRFTFKPVAHSKVVAHLQHIATQEGMTIDDDALALIAQHGGGSFRDSISLLDQMSNTGSTVSLADVQRVLGIAPQDALDSILESMAKKSAQQLVEALITIRSNGYQAPQVAKQLAAIVRQQLLAGQCQFSTSAATHLLKQLLEVPTSRDPDTTLEIILLEMALDDVAPAVRTPHTATPAAATHQPVAPTPPAPPATPPPPAQPTPTAPPAPKAAAPTPPKKADSTAAAPAHTTPFDNAIWLQVLAAIKQHHNTLYGIARMATPEVSGDTVVLKFRFPFHQKKINDAKPKQLIASLVQQLTGQEMKITCVVDADATGTPADTPLPAASDPAPANPAAPLDAISNIFGGAEVVQS